MINNQQIPSILNLCVFFFWLKAGFHMMLLPQKPSWVGVFFSHIFCTNGVQLPKTQNICSFIIYWIKLFYEFSSHFLFLTFISTFNLNYNILLYIKMLNYINKL